MVTACELTAQPEYNGDLIRRNDYHTFCHVIRICRLEIRLQTDSKIAPLLSLCQNSKVNGAKRTIPSYFFHIRFHVILTYTPRFPKRSFPLRFPNENPVCFSLLPNTPPPHVPAIWSALIWSPHWYFAENASNETCHYAVSSAFPFPQHACSQRHLACTFPRLQNKSYLFFEGEKMFLRLSKSEK